MIYSRSSEYAIRALIYLGQMPQDKYAMVRNIAAQENIPPHFLAKILQDLARKGLLRSNKGPTGGFALAMDAAAIRLLDIVEAVDGLEGYEQCPAGHAQCTNATACFMHDSWAALRSRIMEYLGRNTIASLVQALVRKKKAPNGSRPRKVKRAPVAAKRS